MQKHGKAYRAQGWCQISGRLALCGFPSDQEAGKLGKVDREGGGKDKGIAHMFQRLSIYSIY